MGRLNIGPELKAREIGMAIGLYRWWKFHTQLNQSHSSQYLERLDWTIDVVQHGPEAETVHLFPLAERTVHLLDDIRSNLGGLVALRTEEGKSWAGKPVVHWIYTGYPEGNRGHCWFDNWPRGESVKPELYGEQKWKEFCRGRIL